MITIEPLSEDVAPQLAVELGLKLDEYEKVAEILGRRPTITELYMYSLMWSEHCSYKHSRKALRMFPNAGPHVLQGPGENAGVIGVGDGWAVAFKMESHNHPSAIEPYQGAATGVGGIIRDIFTMGARPIASLDSLRFGSLKEPRQRYLFEGSVAGIGGYGNCLGVPTIGGEVYFDDAYAGNCLINAMSLGLMREEDLTRAVAAGPGNLLLLIGSTTGRDGIGGASVLASQEFDQHAEEKRPSVQVGDPFTEKLLIEACLELLHDKLLVALGDLGAAGLTSSASEMASRGGVGLDIEATAVPQREEAMKPFEIMVSESQERMLAVVEPGKLDAAVAVCEKWGLRSTVIGTVTDTGRFIVRENGAVVADMPAAKLAHDAPEYDPPMREPSYIFQAQCADIDALRHAIDKQSLTSILEGLLASPNICSRRWIWDQYDHQVMLDTVLLPGGDAAVLRIKGTDRGIAVTTDCNGRYCYLDPFVGAQIAFAEAARNIACVGARPAAITDCLNFGNPEKPEVYWTFYEAVRGLAEACTAFEVPVVSGNVSFYNETFGEAIYPTPVVGMVGVLDDVAKHMTAGFKDAGDAVVLLGETLPEVGGSEYVRTQFDLVVGAPPTLDLERERAVHGVTIEAIQRGLIKSAHDCSEGGIGVTLAECCIAGSIGATLELKGGMPPAVALFSESQSRIVVTVDPARVGELAQLAEDHGIPHSVLGSVGGKRLAVKWMIDATVERLREIYEGSLERMVFPEQFSTEELREG